MISLDHMVVDGLPYPWDITLSEYKEMITYFVQKRIAGLNTTGETEHAFRIHLNKTRNRHQ